MVTSYRLADSTDIPRIHQALDKMKTPARSWGFVGTLNEAGAKNNIAQEVRCGNGVIVRDFLIMVAEIVPWYSNETVLQEWFTLKLGFRGLGRQDIVPSLLSVAASRNCRFLISGDTSGALSKTWRDGGMLSLTQSFYKEVPHGVR